MPDSNTSQFPAAVVQVRDDGLRIVINRGRAAGVKEGQRFLVYGLSDEALVDPETQESLGLLEIVRGMGQVEHVQEAMSTLRSIKSAPEVKRIVRNRLIWAEETITEPGGIIPFDGAKMGDKARPV